MKKKERFAKKEKVEKAIEKEDKKEVVLYSEEEEQDKRRNARVYEDMAKNRPLRPLKVYDDGKA